MDIRENINRTKQRIAEAAKRAGRSPDEITLIAVTKTVKQELIQQAIDAGVTNIGENIVKEFLAKYKTFQNNVLWHLIGTLQTNKIKYIIDKNMLIHSLDRVSLAVELEKRASKINKVVPALIQINIGKEKSKSGIYEEDLHQFLIQIGNYPHLRILGLMAIAPLADDPEDVRPYFTRLRHLFDEFKNLDLENVDMKYLSMGMSNDFEVAIEEGANMVRIGRAIFGERSYSKGEC